MCVRAGIHCHDSRGAGRGGHLDVVLDLGLGAAGPQREHTLVVQVEGDELTVGIRGKHL